MWRCPKTFQLLLQKKVHDNSNINVKLKNQDSGIPNLWKNYKIKPQSLTINIHSNSFPVWQFSRQILQKSLQISKT